MNKRMLFYEILLGQVILVALMALAISAKTVLLRHDWIGLVSCLLTSLTAMALLLAYISAGSVWHKPNLVLNNPDIVEVKENHWFRTTTTDVEGNRVVKTEFKVNLWITLLTWIFGLVGTLAVI